MRMQVDPWSQWVKDLALLWLWCRLAAAAPIWPPPPGTFHMKRVQPKKRFKKKKKKKKESD